MRYLSRKQKSLIWQILVVLPEESNMLSGERYISDRAGAFRLGYDDLRPLYRVVCLYTLHC